MHEHHAAAHVAGEAHLVRDHQQRHALRRQRLHDGQHLVDELGIERRRDLVAQEGDRLHGERPGDGDALLLAARELVRVGVELVREADLVENAPCDGLGFRLRGLLDDHLREHHVAARGMVREQVEALEDHADLQSQRLQVGRILPDMGSRDRDRTIVDALEPVDASQQRRLARAALADDGDHLAAVDVEVDALEDLVCAEALADLSDLDERHELPFESLAAHGEGPAEGEIDERHEAVDRERLERRVGHDRAGLRELDEPDDGGQRRALDHLHREADGRRDRDAQGLGQDHVPHLLEMAHAEARGCLPLASWRRLRRSRARSRPGRRRVQSVSAAKAAAQAGTSIPMRPSPKNARKSCIRSGVPWNSSM